MCIYTYICIFFCSTEKTPVDTTKANTESTGKDALLYPKKLETLGTDPTVSDKLNVPIDEEMTKLWSEWTKNGLDQNNLHILLNQYNLPEFLITPEINPELLEILDSYIITQDECLKETQELTAHAIISASSALTVLMADDIEIDKDTRLPLTNMTSESIQLKCHLFYEQIQTRRSFIIFKIRNLALKALLEQQKVDKYLFGVYLSGKIKSFKSNKSVADELSAQGKSKNSSGQSKAKSFLYQRSQHPYRKNQHWSDQGS